MTSDDRLLIVIAGPTSVGKTSAGIKLARQFSTEIISADSRQFYHEMKIGTAFPSPEQLGVVPHHFAGHLSIHDIYNVSRYETDVIQLLEQLFRQHRFVFLVGGSGLYINAVCHGIDLLPDPEPGVRQKLKELLVTSGTNSLLDKLIQLDPAYACQVDPGNPARLIRALEVCITTGLPYSSLRTNKPKKRSFRIIKLGLELPREVLNQRISTSVDTMMHEGLVEEARDLYSFRYLNALNTVGYKELFDHFNGLITLNQTVEKIKTNTRRYAKRQMTWFRRDHDITWFNPDDVEKMVETISGGLGMISDKPVDRVLEDFPDHDVFI